MILLANFFYHSILEEWIQYCVKSFIPFKIRCGQSFRFFVSIYTPAGSIFKETRRNDDCRICGQLECEGVTSQLYDDHLSTYPTGCPKFIAMKMVKRKDIAIKAKFCLWCLDPEITYDASHRDTCRVKTGKIKKYTCEVSNCKNHMWLCSFHKQNNSAQLKRHQDDLKKKGLDMALTNWCARATRPVTLLDEDEATEAVTRAVRKAA